MNVRKWTIGMIIPLTAAFTVSTAPTATAVGAAPQASLAVVQPFDPGFDDPIFRDPVLPRTRCSRRPIFPTRCSAPPVLPHPVFRPPFFRTRCSASPRSSVTRCSRAPIFRHPVFRAARSSVTHLSRTEPIVRHGRSRSW
jgi:hypothetical protein